MHVEGERLLFDASAAGGGVKPAWADHYFRFRAADGRKFFVSEPYPLSRTAWRELLLLAADGWNIHVDELNHYGNGTVQAVIESVAQRRRSK